MVKKLWCKKNVFREDVSNKNNTQNNRFASGNIFISEEIYNTIIDSGWKGFKPILVYENPL